MKKIFFLFSIIFFLFVSAYSQENNDDTIKGPPLPCVLPDDQATNLVATATSSSVIDLTWLRGAPSPGDNVIVLAHSGGAVDSDPVDGTPYTANAAFGSGTQIGTGNYVVYIGAGTAETVTALTAGTTYHFAVYEFNNTDNCYLLPGITANATTDAAAPTISNVSPNSFFADKGKTLTITGNDLGGMGATVTIAGVTGTVSSNDGSTLVVDFPAGLYINNTLTVNTGVAPNATSTVTVNTRNIIPVGGGTDFHATIQDALDGLAAWFTTSAFNTSTAGYLSGTKTIDVYNGTYTEKVITYVTLGTTAAENLIIQNHVGEAPVVDASGLSNAFYVGALDYVHIIGFTAHSSTGDVIYTEGDNNLIKYNKVYGSTAGTGIILNGAASTTVINNLIYNNNQFGVRLISSNNAIIENNTIADNGNEAKGPPLPSIYTPAQLYVESGTGVEVSNNIIYSKSGTNIFTLLTEPTITVTSNYNTYFKNGNNSLVYYNGTVYADLAAWSGNGAGANDIETDPDFVNAGTDFHIKSTFGSYPYPAQWPPIAAASAWNNDATNSPALDAGNPADAFANEPASGGIINQGVYGNTAQASKSVACVYPTTQATVFTSTPDITTIDIGWTRGDGDFVIVLAHEGAAVDADPMDGTTYTANATFTSGTQIGTGNYVVYIGAGTAETVTGLTAGTDYYFAVYEFSDANKCYLLPALTGNTTTLVASPTITSVTPNNFFADKGKTITIVGTNLGGMGTTVAIAGVIGTVTSNDGSSLVVDFPAGLYTANVLTVATGVGTDATSTVTVNTRNIIPVGGGTDFHATIQDALDGLADWFTTSAFNTSTAGYLSGTKTIDVYNGTYTEKVIPDVTLGTTASENLIIQNHSGETPVVDASGLSNAFYVGALDYVQIIGFTAYSSTGDVIYTEGDNNLIKYNKVYGSTAGAGIVLNGAASTTVINNLIYNNNQFGVRLISSNNVIIENNTIADNGNEAKGPPLPSIYTPAQLYVESGTGVEVSNNIISAKSGTNIFTLLTEPTITVTSNYNTYFKNGNNSLVYYNGVVYSDLATWTGNGAGANEVETTPTFIGGGDYHILSTAGSYAGGFWPPITAVGGAWVLDASTSTALDAGDPADAFANEPQSGSIINQGAYGNTAQASKSPSSFVWEGDDVPSDDWFVGLNWSGGVVPTAGDNAIIPAGCPDYPIVDAAGAVCFNLNISDGGDLEVTTGGNIIVGQNLNLGDGVSGTMSLTGGDFNVTGTFTANTGSNFTITSGTQSFGTRILNANSIVTYNGIDQNIYNWPYADVVLNGTGTMLITGTTVTPTTCDDFTINATGNVLNIPVGMALTVNGTMTNNVAGNTGIVVKSDATGDGSLIFSNTGVNGTVERYLSKTIGEDGQWHYLGSPVTAAPLTLFNTNNFYQYSEVEDDWWTGATYFYNGTSGWSVPAGNLTVGQGYIYYYYETTINFEGEINYNAAGISTTATYTTHGGNAANGQPYTNFDGWLCVSNPYPSALDWTAMGLTDVNNTVYYYDDATDNYKYYTVAGPTYDMGITVNGGSQYIPSGQGFFVKSDNAVGGTFTIPNAARVHNNQQFWKGKNDVVSPTNLMRFQLDLGDFVDEMVVYFNEEATSEFDCDYDAYKRFSWNAQVPQIYTLNNEKNTEFAINSLQHNLSQVIPLGVKVGTVEEYTIRVTEMNELEFDYIYLEDLNDEVLVNLFEQNEYTFLPENTEMENDRFLLHFGMNQAPIVVNQIENQQTLEDELFSLNIQNTFEDNDMEDTFIIEAKQADGSDLPIWLTFNSDTKTLEGTPENSDVGIVELKLIATDTYEATTEVLFTLEVINTNDAPTVVNLVENQVIYNEDSWIFQFNENTFNDIDSGDELLYSVKLNGEELPSWISFNSDNRVFMANPTLDNLGVYDIELTATDLAGAFVPTNFVLTVLQATGIEDLDADGYLIYPNPTQDLLNLHSYQNVVDITITDILGKNVYLGSDYDNSKIIEIDISDFANGTYMMTIRFEDNSTVTKKIIKK